MARRNHPDDFTRVRRIRNLEEKRSLTSVAEDNSATSSAVYCIQKLLQRWHIHPPSRTLHSFESWPSVATFRRMQESQKEYISLVESCLFHGYKSFLCQKRFSTSVTLEKDQDTVLHPSNMMEGNRYGSLGVVVWGDIMLSVWT
ncbi:hypothetical protein TNCV_3212771 [Trichonephila clavipes]|nr:hypothetical protein TNCV_3212771 [Trichonephila clavipes]